MKTLEQIRQTPHLLVRTVGIDGGFGHIYRGKRVWASVIWSNGGGWEHVSVSPMNRKDVPSWEDMCKVKDMFFGEEETVVQYHPARSQYVNNIPNCLHLWRPLEEKMPAPPSYMVGVRDGQTFSDVVAEAEADLGK